MLFGFVTPANSSEDRAASTEEHARDFCYAPLLLRCSMSMQQARAKTLDWSAIAQTERHDMIGELQRHLGLKPAQKNEAMRCDGRVALRC